MLASAFPERTILVRPHPIESHVPWQEIASQHKNVVVAADGNVVPWLMACDALVHNGCTTAVEAAVLGTPAVAYQPVQSNQHDDNLPNALSHSALDDESLRSTLREILGGRVAALDSAESRRLVDLHIGARDGALAVDRMVEQLRADAGRQAASAQRLDFLLWNRGQSPEMKAYPRHRARSVYY